MIVGIMIEVMLAKADGFKFETNMKGRSKTGRKSIIDMDYQEAHIIANAVDSGMNTLTAYSLVNYHREVEELPSVCIYEVGTCIAKLKNLVVKVKNKKQGSLDRNAPNFKSILLWCLKFSLRMNIITVGDASKFYLKGR